VVQAHQMECNHHHQHARELIYSRTPTPALSPVSVGETSKEYPPLCRYGSLSLPVLKKGGEGGWTYEREMSSPSLSDASVLCTGGGAGFLHQSV
jgi:hypothetical protein